MHQNLINGKRYIGITSRSPEKRWGKNGNEYITNKQPAFARAIQKYGWDNFSHVILFDGLSKTDACEKEIELIEKYKTNCTKYKNPSYGYNMSDGGQSGSYGCVWSEEAKNKLSNILKGRTLSEESRKKLSQSRMGMQFSDEHKKNLSISHQGKPSPRKGVHLSDESKAKISKSKKFIGNIPIFCIELKRIFYGALEASRQLNIDSSAITKCCRQKQSYAGKCPITNNPLHWMYAEDRILTNGIPIKGAISLGYITQEDLNNYLNNLKQKET